ncbi:ribbon-helix-helix domain-containing protein [Candidatus Woesearchaeota archaeon]|nr:ribbon-helix-helix domain-containing protein [Candidatus Woesearchaeota archaeon]
METKLINVRLPKKLYREGKELVEQDGFANFQEFIKDAIRHSVQERKKDQAFINLYKNLGSTKGKERKIFTKEVKDKLAEELIKNLDKQKELFNRAGL